MVFSVHAQSKGSNLNTRGTLDGCHGNADYLPSDWSIHCTE